MVEVEALSAWMIYLELEGLAMLWVAEFKVPVPEYHHATSHEHNLSACLNPSRKITGLVCDFDTRKTLLISK